MGGYSGGRKLTADTPLADVIRGDGRPMYLVAALAGLGTTQLSHYCKGDPIPARHLQRLCAVLYCEVEDILGVGAR